MEGTGKHKQYRSEISVSVNPQQFDLPPTKDRETTMEIKNRNPHPVYYKVDTTNVEALRVQPKYGYIPSESQASLIVQYNPTLPIRWQEEIVVLTSLKPFAQSYKYDSKVNNKHEEHGKSLQKRHIQSEEESADQDDSSKPSEYKKNVEPKIYSGKEARSYESYCRLRKMDVENVSSRGVTEHCNKEFAPYRQDIYKNTFLKETPEMDKICLHAFIDRKSCNKCECNNCADLIYLQKTEEDGRHKTVKPANVPSDSLICGTRPLSAEHHSVKRKEAAADCKNHLETRYLVQSRTRGDESRDRTKLLSSKFIGISDTDSDVTQKGRKQKKKVKYVSEEVFKKRLEKAKKKKQDKLSDVDWRSLSTSEGSSPHDESEKVATRKATPGPVLTTVQSKCTIVSIDETCSSILHISRANFFLLLTVLVIVVGCIASGHSYFKGDPTCFYRHFQQ